MKKLCPSCSKPMIQRDGKFGPFLFCKAQAICGQETISCSVSSVSSSSVALHQANMISSATIGPSWSLANQETSSRPFDPETDHPMYDDGDDYRPFG